MVFASMDNKSQTGAGDVSQISIHHPSHEEFPSPMFSFFFWSWQLSVNSGGRSGCKAYSTTYWVKSEVVGNEILFTYGD